METFRKFLYALIFLPAVMYFIGFKKVIHRNRTAIFIAIVFISLFLYLKFYQGSVEEQIDAIYE